MKNKYYCFRRVYVVKGKEHIWCYTNEPLCELHGCELAEVYRRSKAVEKVVKMEQRRAK